MKLIKPVTVTDAMLISSSVAEDDYAAWNSATTYALGDRVIRASTHKIYESLQAGNLNKTPENEPTWWAEVGLTNRWAMFDQGVGTVTSGTTPLTVTLAPGIVRALALLDIDGTSVTVSMLDAPGGNTVYDKTFEIPDNAVILDWHDYFFAPFEPTTTLIVEDLPPYANCRLTVAIAAAATAKCGTLAVGELADIGRTLSGAKLGIVDYSRKETDEFGVTTVIERNYARRVEADFVFDARRTETISRLLASVRALPVVWIVDGEADGNPDTIVYGFFKDFDIVISYPTFSEASITIEGLV